MDVLPPNGRRVVWDLRISSPLTGMVVLSRSGCADYRCFLRQLGAPVIRSSWIGSRS